jgi:heme oxygenase (mycobilin-producing)
MKTQPAEKNIKKEGMMIVKVMIKREVTQGKEKEFFLQLKTLRFHAMDQKGYISGETLINTENTKMVVVIGTWETIEDWNRWKKNEKRIQLDSQINTLLDHPAVYESYVYGKYRAAAEQGFPPPLQKMDL